MPDPKKSNHSLEITIFKNLKQRIVSPLILTLTESEKKSCILNPLHQQRQGKYNMQ